MVLAILESFMQKKVEQICIGEYQIIFNLEHNLNICVEGCIEYNNTYFNENETLLAAKKILECLGQTITRISISDDHTLMISFDNDDSMKFFQHDSFEAYQLITTTDHIVCTVDGVEIV